MSREQRQQQNRRVSFRHDDDGSLILTCHLPAELGAIVMKALDVAVEGLPMYQDVPAGTSQEIVPFSQRRADALGRVAESFLAHDVLESPAPIASRSSCTSPPKPCATAPPAVARSNTARPSPRRLRAAFPATPASSALVEDWDGEPLNVGRKTRTISAPLRRLLEARDKGCRFPGCANARYVDMHHIRHWANGGETRPSNLVSLCRFHHRAVHEGGFDVEVLDDGALMFVRPDGAAVDGIGPEGSERTGDWRQLPPATGQWRYRGDRLDLSLAVDVMIERARKTVNSPHQTS